MNLDLPTRCFFENAILQDVMVFFQSLNRHQLAYADRECDSLLVMNPGVLHWRDGGEKHMNDPTSIANMQVGF